MATKLLHEGGLAVVPRNAFMPYEEGYIHISYAYSMGVLVEGLNRSEKFIQSI